MTIQLYYWSTPNGHKITIFLEEAEVDYVKKQQNLDDFPHLQR